MLYVDNLLSNGFLWSHLAKPSKSQLFFSIGIMIFNFGHVHFPKVLVSP